MKLIHWVTTDSRQRDCYMPKFVIKLWPKDGRCSLLHSASALCWTPVPAGTIPSASSLQTSPLQGWVHRSIRPVWLPADCPLQQLPPIRILSKSNYSGKKNTKNYYVALRVTTALVRLETWAQLWRVYCPFLPHSHQLALVTGKCPSSPVNSQWLKQVGQAHWGDMMWEKRVQLNNRAFNTQLPGPYLAN